MITAATTPDPFGTAMRKGSGVVAVLVYFILVVRHAYFCLITFLRLPTPSAKRDRKALVGATRPNLHRRCCGWCCGKGCRHDRRRGCERRQCSWQRGDRN